MSRSREKGVAAMVNRITLHHSSANQDFDLVAEHSGCSRWSALYHCFFLAALSFAVFLVTCYLEGNAIPELEMSIGEGHNYSYDVLKHDNESKNATHDLFTALTADVERDFRLQDVLNRLISILDELDDQVEGRELTDSEHRKEESFDRRTEGLRDVGDDQFVTDVVMHTRLSGPRRPHGSRLRDTTPELGANVSAYVRTTNEPHLEDGGAATNPLSPSGLGPPLSLRSRCRQTQNPVVV